MKSVFTIFMVLLVSSALIAQQATFNFSGNGARAAGMGYAFTGIADDATSISWNPAGLTQLYVPEVSVIGRVNFGSASLSNPEILGYDSWEYDLASNFQINFASIVIPFSVGDYNIVGGVSYRNIYDFAGDITQTLTDFAGFEYEINDYSEGGINAISPAIGVQLNDMFSLGVAFNILTGSQDGDGFSDISGNEYEYSEEYSGTSVDIGVLVRPSSNFAIGANLNLPHDITIDDADFGEFKVDVPFFFSVGAGVHATDNFLIALDYHSRAWSNSDAFDTDLNLNSIHVGLEYLLTGDNSVIPLRAGFYTNPLFSTDANGDQITTGVFTFGTGIIMNNFIINVAYEFGSSEYDLYDDGFDVITLDESSSKLTFGAAIHLGGND